MSFKYACQEFKKGIREIKIKHDACEYGIKKIIDSMTLEDWQKPMEGDLVTYHKIMQGMGGFRQMRIAKYGVSKYRKLRKEKV